MFYSSHENRRKQIHIFVQISIYDIYNRKLLISSISPTRRPKKENPKQQSFVPSPSPFPSLLNTQPDVFQKAEATIHLGIVIGGPSKQVN